MNAYQYFKQEQEINQKDSKQVSFQNTQSNFTQSIEPNLKKTNSQNNRSPQVDMKKYKDSPLNTQQKSINQMSSTGLTWNGSEKINPSLNLNEKLLNSRTFKFRDFHQKANTPQHHSDFQQQNLQQERNSSLELGVQSQLSDRAANRQYQTQQNFRSPKKIQFSPQIGTSSNPYYQYINPVNFQVTDTPQVYQNKSLQNKRSILSTTAEKTSHSMIQKRQSQFKVNKIKDFSTPNNKTNNTSGNQNTGTLKNSSNNMPLINHQNGNHITGRMQMLTQSNEKESQLRQNSQLKRSSLQEQQQNIHQFQSQKCPQIQMSSLISIPQQHNQLSSLIFKNESKILNAQQQVQNKQIIQNSLILGQTDTPPSSQYNNMSKNNILSQTFSSPFLKKGNQTKVQNGSESSNDKNTPQSCSQIGSRTLTSFPTQSNFKNSINRSSFLALQLEQMQNQQSKEKSSSSDSSSCKSLFDSPLSPPPKSKLMMEMSKYKKEQKEQNANAKAAKKQLNKQKTANSFFRIKKADATTDTQFSEGRLANSMITTQLSKTQQQFISSPIKSLTTIYNNSKYMSNKQKTAEGNANDESNLDSSRSFNEEQEVNDFNINGPQQSQQQEYYNDNQYSEQQFEGTRDKSLKQLTQLYHNSYKNIENILEENKYFQSTNKIEEDMLSVTMKNKLLPRKLGILSLKPDAISPSGQSSQRALKETLNQIFEDASDEAITSFQNLEEKKPQSRLKTPVSLQTQSFTNFTYVPGNSQYNTNKNKSAVQKQQKSKLKMKDDLPFILPQSGQSFLNFEQTKGEKLKQKLNLSYQNIGNNYAEMISKALNHNDLSNLHTINLSNNHLSGVAVLTISKNLPDSIQNIDLSHNSIGANETRGLIPLFDSKKYYQLRKLNIEHNNITDNGLKSIIPSIFSNMSIYVLNISHNRISDQSCDFIKRLLLNSSYLQELYLHWNKISSKGGILIAQGLAENLNIKVLDLSHNGLGAIPKLQCGQKLIQSCSVLESAVKHLDISYNQFTHQECVEIANTLKSNTSIYGVHLEGNESQVLIDPRGFVFFPEKQSSLFEENHQNDIQIVTQRIHSVRTKGPNKLQSFDCKALDNCWLCHGWQEIRFEIKDGSSDLFTGEPVFLHLDFEDYQPIYMDKDLEDPTRFVLCRMCPPNRKITFFFSDPCKNVIYTSKDYKFKEFSIPEGMNLVFNDIVHHHQEVTEAKQTNDAKSPNIDNKKQQNKKDDENNKKDKNSKQKKDKTPINKNKKRESNQNHNINGTNNGKVNEEKTKDDADLTSMHNKQQQEQEAFTDALDEISKTIKKTFKVKYLDGTVIEYHAPTYVNYIETTVQKDIICKKKDYEPNVKAKPRQPETFFRITKTDLWHRGISLFRDYIPDSDALDKRCFEFDWNTSKLPKLLEKGKDSEECKQILQSVYSQIRIAYKYLSCTGIANDVFCITQNPFSNFAQKAQIIDGNLLLIRDIDFNFISASNIALKVKTYRNPDKALIRNEFLEVMGRIALDKYIRNEKAKANSEAMRMFFHEEGLLNHLLEYDAPQEWRRTRFWNQECDEKLKAQLPFLKILYNNFADSRKNEKRYFTTIKSMSLQEFKDMVYKYDLLDDLLVERDIIISFNLAMMTQVDELNNDRHFQMTFVEFIEAISRLAEKKSMVPLGEISEEYEIHERIVLLLQYKIESMLALMKKKHETFVKEGQAVSQLTQQSQQQQQEISQKQQNIMQGVVNMLKRKSVIQNNTNTPPNNTSQRNIRMQDESINFIKKLTMRKGTMILDEKKEQDKMNLKNIINKIMNKEKEQKMASKINSKPSSPTTRSPSNKALAKETADNKKNQDSEQQ